MIGKEGSGTLLQAGRPLGEAAAAVVLLHGRGAMAHDIMTLGAELAHPDVALVAPQADANTWYPYSFLAPVERNEPALSTSLKVVADLVRDLEQQGMPPSKTVLLGFSQGACLALEFAARHARRYGGIVGLTGGLIGPAGTNRHYGGSLGGTPVFLGAGDPDPHVPWWRVEETAGVLRRMSGRVILRRYPGWGHAVNEDELEAVRRLISELVVASVEGQS